MFDKEKYREIALNILAPLKTIDPNKKYEGNLFYSERHPESYGLAPYYLLYFMFSDLLAFKNLGRFEKVAWSFPIDYNGQGVALEYRKFGIGLFVTEKSSDSDALEIIKKINAAVKAVRPFYDHLAETAVKDSQINVKNNCFDLHERMNYLFQLYRQERKKYEKNKGKVKVEKFSTPAGEGTSYHQLDSKYKQNANWLAISYIEAFFSWTEHLFIHLTVVGHSLSDGEAVSKLIGAEWKDKFQAVFPKRSSEENRVFNELLLIRQQLRNFVAHGAFGKNGNAFLFHSGTGAVEVIMDHKKPNNRFSLYGSLTFKEEDVIKLIEDFIKYLWNGPMAPAMIYTQEHGLPAILPYASNGLYENAVKDVDTMKEFSFRASMEFDNAANMDW